MRNSNLDITEAKRLADAKKLYKVTTGEKGSLLRGGRTHYSLLATFSELKDVSFSVASYFRFLFLTILFLVLGTGMSIPALLYATSSGMQQGGFWSYTTLGNTPPDKYLPEYLITLDTLFCVAFGIFLLVDFFTEDRFYRKWKAQQSARASDYTVMVRVPSKMTDAHDLALQFQEKWGDVSAVAICHNSQTLVKKQEELAIEMNEIDKATIKEDAEATAKHTSRAQKLKAEIKILSKKDIKSTTHAFVTFTFAKSAHICVYKTNASFFTVLYRNLVGGIASKFDIDYCTIKKADDPSDLIYANLDYRMTSKFLFFIAVTTAYFLVAISAWFLLVALLNTEQQDLGEILLLGISALMAIINFAVKRFAFFSVEWIKAHTYTFRAVILSIYLIVGQILNGGLLLLTQSVTFTQYNSVTRDWFSDVSKPILTLIIFNCIISIVLEYIKPIHFIRSRYWYKRSLTQHELNMNFDPPHYEVSLLYSTVISNLFTLFLFSTGFPIMYGVACLLFFVKYWVDKYSLTRQCARPRDMNPWSLNAVAREILLLGLLAHFMFGSTVYDNFAVETSGLIGDDEQNLTNYENNLANYFVSSIGILALLVPIRCLYLLVKYYKDRLPVLKTQATSPYWKVEDIESYIKPNCMHKEFAPKPPGISGDANSVVEVVGQSHLQEVEEEEKEEREDGLVEAITPTQKNQYTLYWINPHPLEVDPTVPRSVILSTVSPPQFHPHFSPSPPLQPPLPFHPQRSPHPQQGLPPQNPFPHQQPPPQQGPFFPNPPHIPPTQQGPPPQRNSFPPQGPLPHQTPQPPIPPPKQDPQPQVRSPTPRDSLESPEEPPTLPSTDPPALDQDSTHQQNDQSDPRSSQNPPEQNHDSLPQNEQTIYPQQGILPPLSPQQGIHTPLSPQQGILPTSSQPVPSAQQDRPPSHQAPFPPQQGPLPPQFHSGPYPPQMPYPPPPGQAYGPTYPQQQFGPPQFNTRGPPPPQQFPPPQQYGAPMQPGARLWAPPPPGMQPQQRRN